MSQRALRKAAWAFLVLAVAGGCESTCARRAVKKPPEVTDDAEAEPTSAIQMLDEGTAPRFTLGVGRWVGLRYRVKVETDSSFGLAGQAPVNSPKVLMQFTYEVVRGTANPVIREIGGRELRLVEERAILDSARVETTNAPADLVAKYNDSLRIFQGSSVRQLVSEEAEIVEMKSESLSGVKPTVEIQKMLDDGLEVQRRFPFRLPPLPVGAGAKWRFSEDVVVGGIHGTQIADMTLLSLDDKTARIRFRVRQEAPEQAIPHPTEPGQKATLEHYRGDGEGDITVDRLTAIALEGRVSVASKLDLSSDVRGKHEIATFNATVLLRAHSQILSGDEGEAPSAAPSAAPPASSVPAPPSAAPSAPAPSSSGARPRAAPSARAPAPAPSRSAGRGSAE